MRVFKNYRDEECFLSKEQEEHIVSAHPDATLDLIAKCLTKPLEIRRSSVHSTAHLYYFLKTAQRYFCVVVKCYADGNYISTAYTTDKIKNGETIYHQKV